MNKKTFGALIIAFIGVCMFLFLSIYNDAKNTAIRQTNETQMVHAKVAARGIEEYFTNWIGILDALSKTDDIINNNSDGKLLIKLLQESRKDEILAISRISENGIITDSSDKRIIGISVAHISHIKKMLELQQITISDIFITHDGLNAISIHVPIFKHNIYRGSIGIMLNYKAISKRYIEEIKIGETGHAWAISRNSIELYSPNSKFIGRSILENFKGFPSITPMINEMLKGHQGYATYQYDRARGHKIGLTTKLAVYTPVHLKNTFWSIAVVSNRDEAVQSLVSFRNRLILIILVFFIIGTVFITIGIKAWLIFKEEAKRKKAETLLKESEEQYHKIYNNALEGMFQIRLDGKLTKANKSLAKILGYDSPEAVLDSKVITNEYLWVNREKQREFMALHQKQDVIREFECQTRQLNGEVIWISLNSKIIRDENGNNLYFEGFLVDITERKKNEQTIKEKMKELQWHYEVTINRELKMVELKKEINSLLEELNRDKKYN